MNIVWQQLCDHHFKELSLLASLAADESLPVYIVGGCLRDALLNRPSADYDIASAGDPTALAKRFSRRIKGHWFSLDGQRGYSRVVKDGIYSATALTPVKTHSLQIDFAPLRAESIEGDIALRDFTINAMATVLSSPISPENNIQLIDMLDAKNDLAHGLLRMCSAEVLPDDPLRIIKGLRHCAQLGFAIEENTLLAFKRYAPLLNQIAGERIRHELAQILAAQHHQQAVSLFIQCGGAKALGLNGDEQYVLQNYTILQVKIATILKEPSLSAHMLRFVGDDFTVLSLIRFISLLRCFLLEDENIDKILHRLHFNKRLRKLLSFSCKISGTQLTCFSRLACSERGKLLWLQQHGAPLPESLLVCALFADAQMDPFALAKLYNKSFELLHNNKMVPLLTSQQVVQQQSGFAGKMFGAFFSDLNRQEILGHVNTEQEAIDYLNRWHESN